MPFGSVVAFHVGPWTIWEIVFPGGAETRGEYPFAEELLSGRGDRVVSPIQKMRLLAQHGERARQSGLDVVRADDKTPEIHILKCKPSCWRLYYHVQSTEKRFVFLRAKCKKKGPQDREDVKIARRRLTKAHARIRPFPFPR
jgi:hypothetical protein